MGKFKVLAACFAVAVNTLGCARAHSAPDLLAKYHFAGTGALASDTNAAKLNEIFNLPASEVVRSNILQKLAQVPLALLPANTSESVRSNSMVLVRPILEDLFASESLAEVRRGTNAPGEIVFAIRLPDTRAALWQTNLATAMAGSGAKPSAHQWKQFQGWELKRQQSPNLVRVIRAKDWLVLGIGQNSLPLQDSLLQKIQGNGQPASLGTNWLEATVDWPAVQSWMPRRLSFLKPGLTQVTVSGKADNVRTVLRVAYPENINWKGLKWQIPTNVIRDPLVSFTAANNVAPLMKTPASLNQLGVNPFTNQFYIWAQSPLPFFSFAAVPEKGATNALKKISAGAPRLFNDTLAQRKAGKLVQSTNDYDLVWKDLSLLTPYLTAIKEPLGEYLFAGLFPKQGGTNPPPPELVAQIVSRTNLIYYDWELTQYRLGQWQLLGKVLPIFPAPAPLKKDDVAGRESRKALVAFERWQSAVAPMLGNTATEVTVTSPRELTVIRKSHLGLTGFEIIMLGHWLNDPQFPFIGNTRGGAAPASSARP